MINQQKKYKFPEEIKKDLDKNLEKYPPENKQSAILCALKLVQKSNGGWIEEEHMRVVADYLDIDYIAVYEVATFYSMIKTKPVGKHLISICNNISCKLKGADSLVQYIEEYLQIKLGETTSDGLITLEKTECLGACVDAPSMIIDDEYEENLTKDKINNILGKLLSKDSE